MGSPAAGSIPRSCWDDGRAEVGSGEQPTLPAQTPGFPSSAGGRGSPQPHTGPLGQARLSGALSEKPWHPFYKKHRLFEEMGGGGGAKPAPHHHRWLPPTLAHRVPADGKQHSQRREEEGRREGGGRGCLGGAAVLPSPLPPGSGGGQDEFPHHLLCISPRKGWVEG